MDILHIVLLISLVVLFFYHLYRERCHDKERQDLYNRFMAAEQIDYSSGDRKVNLRGRNLIKNNIEKYLSVVERPPE